ncbi:MAG TPA: serine/threonine protein kinase, partial [Acidimicrobiales bacterium]
MERCQRPGCDGTIEDGYCTACGLAPVGAAPAAAAAVASASGASTPAETRSTRSTRTSRSTRSGSTRRRASGVALSALPPVPPIDPLAALVPGEVPARKRFCSNCDAKLTRESGYCPKCGQQYSFKPTLAPGSVVAGKYEVKGTVAFGGLGWIYLAMDTVLNRWVVLKGLLNSRDPNMVRLAVQEREYLAAVKHRNIVGIYDFVTEGSEGFIVMEYVNGKSLLQLRRDHGGPLPPLDACSYILELLPAFSYLDSLGMVYCDFKIENAIVEGETVKLIDMGAVRRIDSDEPIYG